MSLELRRTESQPTALRTQKQSDTTKTTVTATPTSTSSPEVTGTRATPTLATSLNARARFLSESGATQRAYQVNALYTPSKDPTPVPVPAPTPNATPTPGTTATPGAGPTPQPVPGPTPTTPTTPAQQPQWTPEDETKVKSLIDKALADNGGDVSKAFAQLRDLRQKPENYYDTNLAIAADYLRARWETQRCGPSVAGAEVEGYLALKRAGGVPKEGPGPVSPYSDLEAKYMRKGVQDETDKMSFWQKVWWASPPGQAYGMAQAAWGVLRGEEG